MSWIPVLQIATNIGTPLALAGFAFTILFFILKQLISSRLLRQVTRDQTFTIIMSIVNVLFWLSVLSLIAGTASYLFKVSLGSPILHVRPSVIDSFLSWQNGNFNPYPEHGDDPFAIKIKNIGTGNAINLTITFSLSIDADELARMALKSDLFLGRNITGGVKKLTVPTRFGDLMAAQSITLTGENLRRRDEISPANEITVPYPSGIKDEIALWLLVMSNSQDRAWMTKVKTESTVIGDPQLPITSRIKLIRDQVEEMRRTHILVLPDIMIIISYQNTTTKETYTIRSIYDYMSSAEWVTGIEPKKLSLNDLVKAWLAIRGIDYNSGGYNIGQPEGGDERILTWDVRKLGEQPNMEQLQSMASFARNRQQVLVGGKGTLSYEDQDNPSDGFFNSYKSQGLFTPRTG